MLGAIDIPGVTDWITCSIRSPRRLSQVVMAPATLHVEPQLMDVTVVTAVDNMLGAIDIPGVTGWITRSICSPRRLSQVVMAPATLHVEPQFMDVTVITAVDYML